MQRQQAAAFKLICHAIHTFIPFQRQSAVPGLRRTLPRTDGCLRRENPPPLDPGGDAALEGAGASEREIGGGGM